MDELAYRRQRRCAESRTGHTFTDGRCQQCGLRILPPPGQTNAEG